MINDLKQKMGMSVILITHDLGAIAENCDNAVVMYGGRVAESAEVVELFKNPLHPYTKGLLKSIRTCTHPKNYSAYHKGKSAVT